MHHIPKSVHVTLASGSCSAKGIWVLFPVVQALSVISIMFIYCNSTGTYAEMCTYVHASVHVHIHITHLTCAVFRFILSLDTLRCLAAVINWPCQFDVVVLAR